MGRRICSRRRRADIEFADGMFTVAGTDRAHPALQVARASYIADGHAARSSASGSTATGIVRRRPQPSRTAATICEVEIDPETGEVEIDRYTAVDDVGLAINPLLLDGQVHGGVVQGVGQALMEDVEYDKEGQLLSGSFMDYCMPRADMIVPSFEVGEHHVPTHDQPARRQGRRRGGHASARRPP